MKSRIFFIATIAFILSGCTTSKTGGVYTPKSEYDRVSEPVTINQESSVQFSDGAQIVIPANSITSDTTVIIERNPDKSNSLPPLGDNDLPLSDFYNFQIEGGNLIGSVDLIIPFDDSKIPKEGGFLVAMIPTENGWKYVPVETYENKAYFYTAELGDPLIAWHFTDLDSSTRSPRELADAGLLLCDPTILLDEIIDQQNKTVTVVGRLVPLQERYFGFIERKPAENVPITIYLNTNFAGYEGRTFTTTTDSNGQFGLTLDATDETTRLKDGWNNIYAQATCDKWPGEMTVESESHWQIFTLNFTEDVQIVSPEPTEPLPAQPENIQPPKSPTEYVLLPNVIGLPFDYAIGFLERIGYKVIWIDGKSTFEVGQVFSQSPKAGSATVPHRTTVVLFRTIEKVEQPPECAQFNLTPEECANSGTHKYVLESETYCDDSWKMKANESVETKAFTEDAYTISGTNGATNTYYKVALNTYENDDLEITRKIIFRIDGYEYIFGCSTSLWSISD